MKRILALVLALVMLLLTGCSGSGKTNKTLEGSMEELVGKILEIQPVEFMAGMIPVDLSDASEDGLWAINYNTGLEDGKNLTDIAVFEPTMGSQAFSLVLVRVSGNAKKVAQKMSDGIDTRKWICVEANDKLVAGYADVVMLIMVDSQLGLKAQSFVDAFSEVCGGKPDFII